MTDLGMTGPVDSVIGVGKETAIERSLSQMPLKMEVADSEATIRGARLKIDSETGKTLEINPLALAPTF